jgi:transposase
VVGTRRHSRSRQRIPVAGPVELIWSKRRFFCDESECPRGTFFEATFEVLRLARSTGRLRDQCVEAVIRSGRAVSETAAHQCVPFPTNIQEPSVPHQPRLH